MLTLNVDCEVLADRLVTIKLPEAVHVGRHPIAGVVPIFLFGGKLCK